MALVIYQFHKNTGILIQSSNLWKGNVQKDSSSSSDVSTKKNQYSMALQNNLLLKKSANMRATRMLVIVSTVFLVCNVPCHIARVFNFLETLKNESYVPGPNFLLTQKLFHMLYYVNFSVNFFLYSVSSTSFRNGLTRLFTKVKKS
jgi:hypothetical protein